jgi:hypothetical protein
MRPHSLVAVEYSSNVSPYCYAIQMLAPPIVQVLPALATFALVQCTALQFERV